MQSLGRTNTRSQYEIKQGLRELLNAGFSGNDLIKEIQRAYIAWGHYPDPSENEKYKPFNDLRPYTSKFYKMFRMW